MALNTTGTLLTLSSPTGLPLYAARGLSQSLAPLAAASQVSRSINGRPIDFSYDQFRLYQSKITCTDLQTPLFDGIWPGMDVIVDCVVELSYDNTSIGAPMRTPVDGSTRTEGDIVFYRPRLAMVIININTDCAEYPADYQWEMDLEESYILEDS